MALLDLSLVTKSLVNLIREGVSASSAWPGTSVLNVSPLPPDRLAGDNVIGFYLYHLMEDAHYKNLPAPSGNMPPVRYTPMGLSLQYILSTHSDLPDDNATYQEQLMMGCAVKALRDYPVLDDRTRINGTEILDAGLLGLKNRFKIGLQPLPANEATNYWSAGTSPLRLSAYYQVYVALLEPEAPETRVSRVLSYNLYTFTMGAPRLVCSRNTLSFTAPGSAQPQEIDIQPAQVPFGDRLTFIGSGLTGGTLSLFFKHPDWDEWTEVGADWAMTQSSDRLSVMVQTTLNGQLLAPDIYAARVQITRPRSGSDVTSRPIILTSNQTPFAITPRIDSLTSPDADGEISVSGHLFQDDSIAPEDLQVYVGRTPLSAVTAGPLSAGQFVVDSANSLTLRLPADVSAGAVLPLRLLINSVESPPRWIELP